MNAQNVLLAPNGNSVRLTGGTKSFSLFSNDTEVLQLNRRGFFSFEHSRARPAGEGEEEKQGSPEVKDDKYARINSNDGGWQESFGTHKDSKPRGPQSVGLDISFSGSKHVFGIPEHASDFSLKSTKGPKAAYAEPYRLYNLDVFEYEVDNPMALYGSVPIMLSQSPRQTVGVFWANAAETWVDVEHAEHGVHTHWMSEAGDLDVFFFFGPSPAAVLAQISQVTGTPDLPPLFAIAYHQCRWNYKSQEDVAEVDAGFDSHLMPYDVLWLDIEHTDGKRYFTWDAAHFPSPKTMIDAIAAKGRQMVTIVDPHIKRDNNYYVHSEATAKKYYVQKADGGDYDGWCWPGSSSWVDYTIPAARFWWEELFGYDKYQGSTPHLFTWNDMNEPSVFNGPEVTMHKDALHYNDVEHRELHNVIGLEFHKATAIGLIKRNPDHNIRPFVLSRAFFAGSQRWGAVWTGDNDASWSHLQVSTPMLLSVGITGIPFVGADVGGFFNNPDPHLLVRWYQAGAFQPFFRGHAHLDTNRREPWLFGEPYTSLIREALRARYSFLPFWYTQFRVASQTGSPPMRPLWFNYPHNADTFAIEDQFMVGSDILVKPISSNELGTTDLFLPSGQPWYDIVTFLPISAAPAGGRISSIHIPLERTPVFQRGGSIIAKWERARRSSSQMASDPYTLSVALDSQQSASGELYIDDFKSFDHQNGVYTLQKFSFASGLLSASPQHSGFPVFNQIERVRILGYPKAPSSVTLLGDKPFAIEYSYSQASKVLTLRKPGVSVAGAFKIQIQ